MALFAHEIGLMKNTRHEGIASKKSMDGRLEFRVEKILKGSLDLISSPLPSVKIQIMGGKVRLWCKGKTLLGQ